MDTKQLKKALIPFCRAFTNRYKTKSICLSDEWIGVERTTYTLMIIAPQLPDKEYYPALSNAVDMFWDNTYPAVRKHIHKICLETDAGVHCNEVTNETLLYNNVKKRNYILSAGRISKFFAKKRL